MQKKWDRWELNQQYTTRMNHSLSIKPKELSRHCDKKHIIFNLCQNDSRATFFRNETFL